MMEEFYESDVMWPDNHNRPPAAAASGSPLRPARSTGPSADPVDIPAAGWRRSRRGNQGEEEEDPAGRGAELIPPHVLVSRSRAVGEVAFSLCSGKGRKLKGRDLRHVRDSVLRMTGYLEV